MRTSSYNIYAKIPEEDSYLIIQGYTGAVDCISNSVYQFLMDKDFNKNQISQETIEKLKKRGYLTNRSFIEEREHLRNVARIVHERNLHGMNILFVPTFSCQLRCFYCYEAPISHAEDEFSQAVMTTGNIRSAYDTIDWIAKNFEKDLPRSIVLYGGEPLQAKNYETIRQIVEEGIRRKMYFRAITNGYDLLEYEDLLGKDKIYNLQITIDGPEDVHNKRRFAKKGKPTFAMISDGIQLALDKGCIVNVRTNVDKANVDSLSRLNQFYIDKGWNRFPNFNPYANVTHDWYEKEVIKPIELLNATELIFDPESQLIKADISIDHCLHALLAPGEVPYLRPYFCGANIGMYIFCPDGYIYTCWDEVGLENGRIGQYAIPEPILFKDRTSEWLNRNVANINECLDCRFALICGGGCPHQAKKTTGSFSNPYCFEFQNLFQRIAPKIYNKYINKYQQRVENK